MKKNVLIFAVLTGLILAACEPSPVNKAEQNITKDSLMAPIKKLSSDEFEGRGTGTTGQEKAVTYLAGRFKKYGLKGGMPDGSYVQDVPLVGQKTSHDATLTITKKGKKVQNLDYYADFMAWPANMKENINVQNADLVYVGYGIQAPEENWDDFKKADVKGKVIIVKNNDPSEKANLFAGKMRLYYGRYDYKYEKAREMGAAGVLIIHTTPSAGYDWNVVANSWNSEQFYLKSNDEIKNSPSLFNGWLTKQASSKLFSSASLDLEKQLAAAEDANFQPVPLKGLKLSINLHAKYREINSKNVLGIIEGSDSDLKNQYMMFTAHYDHLGITSPVDADSINNGALDNATGVSAVLNMARQYKSIQSRLKRSVLFLLVGAEEKGLLGSKYWATHPTVLPANVTADINLDGMNVYGKTKDIVLVGYGRNSVSDMIEDVAHEWGRTVKPDPHPDRGYFYRSDHFSFAKKGIPSIFPGRGNEFIDKPDSYATTVDSVEDANYHTVNDEINKYWDLSGMVQDTRLFFEAGYRIINAKNLQTWHAGDEFKQVRQNSLDSLRENQQ